MYDISVVFWSMMLSDTSDISDTDFLLSKIFFVILDNEFSFEFCKFFLSDVSDTSDRFELSLLLLLLSIPFFILLLSSQLQLSEFFLISKISVSDVSDISDRKESLLSSCKL